MIPLQDFDFSALDDPEFNEDAVREEVIAPLVRALGYSATGSERVVRGRRLQHPFVSIGVTKHHVSIVPDYLLLVDERPTWVLDAKSPRENVDDPSHDAQVYSYAIHRDVRVEWYAICNGREFALYHVGDMSSTPRIRFELRDLRHRWAEIHTSLRPRGRLTGRDELDKDFGILLLRLGLKPAPLHFIDVSLLHPQIGRVEDGLFRISRSVQTEGQRYLASFDFDDDRFRDLLNLVDPREAAQLSAAFKNAPAGAPVIVNLVGDLGEVSMECALGELEEVEREHLIPLRVRSIWR